jgi:hypothetical protein
MVFTNSIIKSEIEETSSQKLITQGPILQLGSTFQAVSQKSPAAILIVLFILFAKPVLCESTSSLFSVNNLEVALPLTIVENKIPKAVIILGETSSEQVQSAAKTLQTYIKQSSLSLIPIKNLSDIDISDSGLVYIWVGQSKYTNKFQLNLQGLDDDGFVITFPDKGNIVIIGPTDWGTEFGVYEFIERYMGVRWLMPGPDGEHVPKKTTLIVSPQEVRQQPAFLSRQLVGLRGELQNVWARRNRMHPKVKFHHNLYNLFPPEKYTSTHPEYYPVIEGKRYLPEKGSISGWQLDFEAKGIIGQAVSNIINYFNANPDQDYYSLGINDATSPYGAGFSDCMDCQKNEYGYSDRSDQFFSWANAVVDGVLDVHPEKWFGVLAFRELLEPPKKISVHPRIIPYITYDRMKWINDNFETQGKKNTKNWSERTSYLGWYDYIYGTPYMLPRVYFHEMEKYYKFGSENGVKAVYAEAYPNWGEGPKLYITLKLYWNPSQDVNILLQDWYVAAVGKKAAADLAAYYSFWEEFWTVRIPNGSWFKNSGTFLNFTEPYYLELVTQDEIIKSRKLLESVVQKAETKEQKSRANYLLKAFEYYEASALSYLGLVIGLRENDKNTQYYKNLNSYRYKLINEFNNEPILLHPLRFDENRFKGLQW